MKKLNTEIIDDFDDEQKKKTAEEIQKRIEIANEKTFSIIEEFFDNGYKQNLANLLCYLPKERQDQALNKLPENVRNEVINILKDWGEKKNSNPEVLSATGNILKNSDYFGSKAANEFLEPLNSISKYYLESELQTLYKTNPLLALNISYSTIKLDIICDMDNRSIQKWLREVDQQDLAKALKLSSVKTQKKIFMNLSKRAAAMLKEDMEFMGPVRKIDVLEVQDKLIGILKKLVENGDIIVPISLSDNIHFLDELVV